MCCDSTHGAWLYEDDDLLLPLPVAVEEWARCRCTGYRPGYNHPILTYQPDCRCCKRATAEDGLCDRCRANCAGTELVNIAAEPLGQLP
jgi:hypothetical protein